MSGLYADAALVRRGKDLIPQCGAQETAQLEYLDLRRRCE